MFMNLKSNKQILYNLYLILLIFQVFQYAVAYNTKAAAYNHSRNYNPEYLNISEHICRKRPYPCYCTAKYNKTSVNINLSDWKTLGLHPKPRKFFEKNLVKLLIKCNFIAFLEKINLYLMQRKCGFKVFPFMDSFRVGF